MQCVHEIYIINFHIFNFNLIYFNEDKENRPSKKVRFHESLVTTNKSNRPDKSADVQNVGLKRLRSTNHTSEPIDDIARS